MDLRVEIPFPIPVRVHPPEETRIPTTTATTAGGFDFASSCSSPTASSSSCYLSAPPSPPSSRYPTLNNNNSSSSNIFFFYSAPTSPNSSSSSSKIPFNWEESPGIPKSPDHRHRRPRSDIEDDDDDFEFDFSGQLVDQPSISAADELFHAGKIRPLKPPPRLVVSSEPPSPPRSPRSPVISKFRGAFSPRRRKEEEQSFLDPFETALERTRKSDFSYSSSPNDKVRLLQSNQQSRRGRPTTSGASSTSQPSSSNNPNPRPRKGISRSLSPLRVSEFALHMQQQEQQQQQQQEAEQRHRRRSSTTSNDGSFSSSSIASSRGYRKWRLKDLLLFRSASEGRASGKSGPLKKYYSSTSATNLHINTSSFRSDHSVGSSSRRTTAMPPANNRAAAAPEELKSRTLPYKYGFLGCLGFNPLSFGFGYHDASRGFVASSFTR